MGKVPEDFNDWKWPWTEGEIDEEKAARLIWNARRQEEAAHDKAKTLETQVETLTGELDTAKAAKSGLDETGQQRLTELERENRDLKSKDGKSQPQDQKRIWQLETALELGLSKRDASRLVGETQEEIAEDGRQFAKDHNIALAGDDEGGEDHEGDEDGGDEDGERRPPIQEPTPASRLRTGLGGAKNTVASNPQSAKLSLPPLRS